MNLYLISQEENNGYDTYDSAVVAALDEKTAIWMSPNNGEQLTDEEWKGKYSSWCHSPEAVKVKLIGKAAWGIKKGVICASFNKTWGIATANRYGLSSATLIDLLDGS